MGTSARVLFDAQRPFAHSVSLDNAVFSVHAPWHVAAGAAQDLPASQPALEYVEEKARAHDPLITRQACRQALGALGLNGSSALAPIGAARRATRGGAWCRKAWLVERVAAHVACGRLR